MLTARGMLTQRKELITVSALKPFVEAYTSRRFAVHHVQHIKALYPEAFSWQHIRTPSTRLPGTLELQLLLRFDCKAASMAGSGGGAASPGSRRRSDAVERSAFAARVLEYWERTQREAAAEAEADGGSGSGGG
eukprot:44590-Chlamydomonas_euryale.AAC.1